MKEETEISREQKEHMCFFGTIDQHGIKKTFGILDQDRLRHLYVIGKTGMGKSNMLQNMCLQDIYQGKGVCFIDPHGESCEYILDKIPLRRKNDVIYFNPADIEYPIGLNVMEAESHEQPFLIASGIMSVFKRIWRGMWSTRMEYILNNTLLALLEQKDATLLGVVKMLSDDNYAQKIVAQTKNPLVKNFWTREYANFHEKYKQEAVAPILNKIGQFFTTDLIRNIIGQKKSTISFRDILDTNKILLVNLSKGRMGEDNSSILGSLIISKLQLAAMSRVDTLIEDRNQFNVFVDEFQNFTTDSFATILSEARKYGLNLTLAHQYINQLTETGNDNVKGAIFGNIGSIVSFQLGIEDAIRMSLEYEPTVSRNELINLHKTQIAVKLSVRGRTSKAFLAETLPPLFDSFTSRKEEMIEASRKNWSRNAHDVSNQILQYLQTDSVNDTLKKPKKRLRKKPKILPESPSFEIASESLN